MYLASVALYQQNLSAYVWNGDRPAGCEESCRLEVEERTNHLHKQNQPSDEVRTDKQNGPKRQDPVDHDSNLVLHVLSVPSHYHDRWLYRPCFNIATSQNAARCPFLGGCSFLPERGIPHCSYAVAKTKHRDTEHDEPRDGGCSYR